MVVIGHTTVSYTLVLLMCDIEQYIFEEQKAGWTIIKEHCVGFGSFQPYMTQTLLPACFSTSTLSWFLQLEATGTFVEQRALLLPQLTTSKWL